MLQYHSLQYLIMSSIARDYLAIQDSSTPSECAFSEGGLTVTIKRNNLHAETVEALQILKDSYDCGDLSAAVEAKKWEKKPWTPE